MHSPEKNEVDQLLDAGSYWYVLYTRHQHEKCVAHSLSIKGHEIFLPTYYSARRWQDRTKQLSLPLFPCYAFIRGGMDRQLQILSTPGMIGIVGWNGGRPAIVPQYQIDAVRRLVESSLQIEPHPFLRYGDRVRVKAGPLTGLEGILVRKKSMCRLIVSMDLLGHSVAAEIDISCVEGISPLPVAMRSYQNSASA